MPTDQLMQDYPTGLAALLAGVLLTLSIAPMLWIYYLVRARHTLGQNLPKMQQRYKQR
jgi:hypothetical protein